MAQEINTCRKQSQTSHGSLLSAVPNMRRTNEADMHHRNTFPPTVLPLTPKEKRLPSHRHTPSPSVSLPPIVPHTHESLVQIRTYLSTGLPNPRLRLDSGRRCGYPFILRGPH